MSKTSVSTLITKIKRRADYNITDTGLDNLIVDIINDKLKVLNQLFFDYQLWQEITALTQFKTVEDQEYVDITGARIVGDVATFTGAAGDKIDVWIDGVEYADIDISAATDIADVVTAINAAVGATVASESNDSYLVITSPTTGSSSAVIIEDDAAASGAVDSLFSVTAERSQSAITDLDEIVSLSDRDNDVVISLVNWNEFKDIYTDPTASYTTSPEKASRFSDRIYFGSTPSANIYIYMEYLKAITEVTSLSTLPFSNKYDPLLIQMCKEDLIEFLDDTNAVGLAKVKGNIDRLTDELIIGASKNLGISNQSQSRNDTRDYFAPRKPSE